jgi:hypothetical protein
MPQSQLIILDGFGFVVTLTHAMTRFHYVCEEGRGVTKRGLVLSTDSANNVPCRWPSRSGSTTGRTRPSAVLQIASVGML